MAKNIITFKNSPTCAKMACAISDTDHTVKSGRGRPREFDRDLALRKALALFWEQGYMQTTMAQLCNVMGINSPSLYCAFGSKSKLFKEALAYYRSLYWDPLFEKFSATQNLYVATQNLFEGAARILLLPDAPCGCMTVFSALTLPPAETDLIDYIKFLREETRRRFREQLKRAVRAGEIDADCDIPALTGALANFLEGLAFQARDGELCLSELAAIARTGLLLLPPRRSQESK